jgi:hypothetical protein
MKKARHWIALSVLTSAMLLVGASSANAQTSRRLSATPKAFQTFYAKFKSAVLRGDKQAVASMTFVSVQLRLGRGRRRDVHAKPVPA